MISAIKFLIQEIFYIIWVILFILAPYFCFKDAISSPISEDFHDFCFGFFVFIVSSFPSFASLFSIFCIRDFAQKSSDPGLVTEGETS